MRIIVEERSVYGNEFIYPICPKAMAIAKMIGTKTIPDRAIPSIKELGFTIAYYDKRKPELFPEVVVNNIIGGISEWNSEN